MRDNEFKKFQQNILKIINNKTIEKLILNYFFMMGKVTLILNLVLVLVIIDFIN